MKLVRDAPPADVLEAFGAVEPPVRLPGGQGGTFRAGDIILKPADNAAEVAWLAHAYGQVRQDGFRIARPLPSRGGEWVVDGWWSQERLEGRHVSNRWAAIFEACRVFHAGLEGLARPSFLASRTDPWAIADRVAWQEEDLDCDARLAPSVARLTAMVRPVDLPDQVIHGDFFGNVLLSDGAPPAVIDMSPYWRPAAFALAVAAVDAFAWWSAPLSELEPVRTEPHMPQMLARAALRRLIEIEADYRQSARDRYAEIPVYQPLIAWLEG